MSYPGHSLGESYPSAEVQSVYSTAPVDWATSEDDQSIWSQALKRRTLDEISVKWTLTQLDLQKKARKKYYPSLKKSQVIWKENSVVFSLTCINTLTHKHACLCARTWVWVCLCARTWVWVWVCLCFNTCLCIEPHGRLTIKRFSFSYTRLSTCLSDRIIYTVISFKYYLPFTFNSYFL